MRQCVLSPASRGLCGRLLGRRRSGDWVASSLRLDWDGPHGPLVVGLDSLSAFFLLPTLGLSALASVYGGAYLYEYRDRKPLGLVWFLFSLFVAGMMLVCIARTAVTFLVAWEVMSISAFFLVTFEHEQREARRAGWVYLVATHLGVAFLVALFAALSFHAGDTEFGSFLRAPTPGPGLASFLFLLALLGFGIKAESCLCTSGSRGTRRGPRSCLRPHVGVMIKMGVYGLLRTLTFLGPPPLWWAVVLVAAGVRPRSLGSPSPATNGISSGCWPTRASRTWA